MQIVSRTTAAGEVRLAVRVSGDLAEQRPVVLVHGMGGDHSTWRALARALCDSARSVVAVDLRGHGHSGRSVDYRLPDFADDVLHVVDELGVAEFDLVGHSLGAHTAARVAMGASPGRIGALLLEEIPPMPRDDADLAEDITPTASLGERLRGLGGLVVDPWPYLRFDKQLPEQVQAEFRVAEPDWWSELSRIDASTLVISGGTSSFLPPRHLRAVADALPNGDFLTIDAGHSVHRRRPREFADAVLALFA
ncbi:MAG: alpha/beta fold hydrolase [Gordonia sp. (in: high G+C Gram-positive bacteria)]